MLVRFTHREFPERGDGTTATQRSGWLVSYEGELLSPRPLGAMVNVRVSRCLTHPIPHGFGHTFRDGDVAWIPTDCIEEISDGQA